MPVLIDVSDNCAKSIRRQDRDSFRWKDKIRFPETDAFLRHRHFFPAE